MEVEAASGVGGGLEVAATAAAPALEGLLRSLLAGTIAAIGDTVFLLALAMGSSSAGEIAAAEQSGERSGSVFLVFFFSFSGDL
ncbi:unnamed protein product [Spirodela intermedia]|uniref:Uncharacterized protein n=1 Tax=Spirodela intermedia TaxID=51605 RepID=A0A7I8LJK4_SPIIN|nr:unnamed protein product [Spirodela intermedia]